MERSNSLVIGREIVEEVTLEELLPASFLKLTRVMNSRRSSNLKQNKLQKIIPRHIIVKLQSKEKKEKKNFSFYNHTHSIWKFLGYGSNWNCS